MASSGSDSNQPAPLTHVCTKKGLLAHLRGLENQLFTQEVVAKVKQQPSDQQLAFAQARLHLTSVIAKLNATLMKEIRQKLEAQSAELQQGIDRLAGSLGKLEGAVGWAKAINGVISTLGKLVPLL